MKIILQVDDNSGRNKEQKFKNTVQLIQADIHKCTEKDFKHGFCLYFL